MFSSFLFICIHIHAASKTPTSLFYSIDLVSGAFHFGGLVDFFMYVHVFFAVTLFQFSLF